MGKTGTDLGDVLTMLAEGEAPPSTVSAADAVREGRARGRRRRSAAGAMMAIAVVAGAVGSLMVGGGRTPAPASPLSAASSLPSPTMSGSASASPTSGAHPLPTKTVVDYPGQDPLNGMPRFGWLPDSITSVTYSLGPEGVSFRAMAGPFGSNGVVLTVKMFPAGVTPPLDSAPAGQYSTRVDAPPVNGQEAYWVSSNNAAIAANTDALRWKTATGQWAELNAVGLTGADRKSVPLRIAAGLDPQPHDTPLPVRLTGLPAEYTIRDATFQEPLKGGTNWRLDLGFSATADDKTFGVKVTPDGPTPSAPTTGPGGLPLRQLPQTCKSENGLRICLSTFQDPSAVFAAVGGIDAMLPKITSLGTDPNNWTTGVIG